MSYLIALTVLVAVYVQTSESLQCFNCRDVSDPTVCHSLLTCAAGQSCFLETHQPNSRIVYSMGCRDVQVCDARYHAIIGRSTERRQTGTCHECCSADNCNMDLCQSVRVPDYGESESFILFIDDFTLNQMDIETHNVRQVMGPSYEYKTFDYDPLTKNLYWYSTGNIYRSLIKSDQNTPTKFISDLLIKCNAIVIDPKSRLLFFAALASIKVASLETGRVVTVIGTDISSPEALALDYEERKIYWTDSSKQTIEGANYNGSNRRTVINSGLVKPMALAFDAAHKEKELFWVDAGLNKVEKAKVDGTGRQTIPGIKGTDSSGLTILNNYLYFTSKNLQSLMRTSLSGGIPTPFGKSNFVHLYAIKAYNMSNAHLATIVRLAGPLSTPQEGRVELSYDNGFTWNTICFSPDRMYLNVICGMLGWERLDAAINYLYGSAPSNFGTLYSPSCSGRESSITECPNFPEKYGCDHSNDIGVKCLREGNIQLTGSRAIDHGRVEILMNHQWGTICDDNFGPAEAGVACAMLGFSRNGAQLLRQSTNIVPLQYFPIPIHLDDVACNGSEQSLLECKHNNLTDFTDCQLIEDVYIQCQPATLAHVRLIGSNATSSQGTVEISSDGGLTWATVCDVGFHEGAAKVVCHMLGFNRFGASARQNAHFGQGNGSAESLQPRCDGQETSLLHCDLTKITTECSHSHDAGVICLNTTNEKLRLVNGQTASQGLVEVSYDDGNTWGTVCNLNPFDFNNKIAGVVCAALGYQRGGEISQEYGQGSSDQPVFLQDPMCDGTETALFDCISTSTSTCSHHYDMGVVCSSEKTTVVRLANNAVGNGRVEVSVDNGTTWGTICDELFGSHEAMVVCRMLGFNITGAVAITNGTYGAGNIYQRILFDDLNCSGDESSILHCRRNPIGESDCSHNEDVGVSCVGRGYTHLRLAGSNSNSTQGRVEIRFGNTITWGTICGYSFDNNAAAVICSMLGFQRTDALARTSAYFGAGDSSHPILLDDLACQGTEDSILDCGHLPIGTHNCGHIEDAGVVCKP